MESKTELSGTERDGRDSDCKARKRFSVKPNISSVAILVFALLLIIKISISGLYLKSGSVTIPTASVAIAQELDEDSSDSDPSIEEQQRVLRNKEQELTEKELTLNKMEKELLPLKQEIDAKLEELNTLQTSLTNFAKKLAEREKSLKDTKITHLVTLYSNMEAPTAANIIDKLNMDTIVRIMSNMKGKIAGQILAMMDPEKGAVISERLSKLE